MKTSKSVATIYRKWFVITFWNNWFPLFTASLFCFPKFCFCTDVSILVMINKISHCCCCCCCYIRQPQPINPIGFQLKCCDWHNNYIVELVNRMWSRYNLEVRSWTKWIGLENQIRSWCFTDTTKITGLMTVSLPTALHLLFWNKYRSVKAFGLFLLIEKMYLIWA